MCHNKASEGKYYDDWLTTKHANAFLVLKGDERKDPKCLPCHTTGFGKDGGFTALEVAEPKQADMDKALAGVQCEVCHGPGEKHIKSKKDNVIKNAGVPDEKVCLTCHNDTNPHWNPERYTTKDGKKVGFDFEQAIKKVNHSAMKEKK
jgi:predicted CXXCH cytochrome family protein